MNAVYNEGIRPEKPTPEFLTVLLTHRIKIGYALRNVNINEEPNATITAKLYIYGLASRNSYFDTRIQDYCHKLAIFLRDETDYNQFFDIDDGQFTLYF